jgi:hypothetical protein
MLCGVHKSANPCEEFVHCSGVDSRLRAARLWRVVFEEIYSGADPEKSASAWAYISISYFVVYIKHEWIPGLTAASLCLPVMTRNAACSCLLLVGVYFMMKFLHITVWKSAKKKNKIFQVFIGQFKFWLSNSLFLAVQCVFSIKKHVNKN